MLEIMTFAKTGSGQTIWRNTLRQLAFICSAGIPSYTRDVHGLSFTSIGFVTAVPQICAVPVAMIAGAVRIDLRLRTSPKTSDPRMIRRLMTCVGAETINN